MTWISVNERLPSPDTLAPAILTYQVQGRPWVAIDTLIFKYGRWNWDTDGWAVKSPITVTHWLELPPVPKELLEGVPSGCLARYLGGLQGVSS